MVIPLCCVFFSSFSQVDFNVYYIQNMGIQHLALQEWDARSPGAACPCWGISVCSGPGELNLHGKRVGKAMVIRTQLSASRDTGKLKDVPKSWSSKLDFLGPELISVLQGWVATIRSSTVCKQFLYLLPRRAGENFLLKYSNVLYFLGLRSLESEEE